MSPARCCKRLPNGGCNAGERFGTKLSLMSTPFRTLSLSLFLSLVISRLCGRLYYA